MVGKERTKEGGTEGGKEYGKDVGKIGGKDVGKNGGKEEKRLKKSPKIYCPTFLWTQQPKGG